MSEPVRVAQPARRCGACLVAVPRAARFCPKCGASLEASSRAAKPLDGRRRVTAIAVAFVGALLALCATGYVLEQGASETACDLLFSVALCVVGVVAASALGVGGLRQSFAGRTHPIWLALGIPAGFAAFAVNFAYVAVLASLLDVDIESTLERNFALEIVMVAALPALIEEWLCRGVLWSACRPVASFGATLGATSTLFAFLHWFEGAFVSLPHRFVTGLILGLLRERSGSVLPAMIAHFVNNALALVWLAQHA